MRLFVNVYLHKICQDWFLIAPHHCCLIQWQSQFSEDLNNGSPVYRWCNAAELNISTRMHCATICDSVPKLLALEEYSGPYHNHRLSTARATVILSLVSTSQKYPPPRLLQQHGYVSILMVYAEEFCINIQIWLSHFLVRTHFLSLSLSLALLHMFRNPVTATARITRKSTHRML